MFKRLFSGSRMTRECHLRFCKKFSGFVGRFTHQFFIGIIWIQPILVLTMQAAEMIIDHKALKIMENSLPNKSEEFFKLAYVYPEDMHGWFAFSNSRNLKKIIQAICPRKVVEVGTWLGVSAIFIAKSLDTEALIYCIDPWVPCSPEIINMSSCQERLKNTYEKFLSNCIHHKVTDKIVPIRMKSMDAFSSYFSQSKDIDLVYIDGSHAEEDVYKDIIHWFKTLSPNGILCGDDWIWKSVCNAVLRASKDLNKPYHADGNFWWLGSY